MKQGLILGLIITLCLNACGQKGQNNDLIGTWELAKAESDINSELSIIPITKSQDSGLHKNKHEIIIKFNENSIVDVKQEEHIFKGNYSRNGNNLILGSSVYEILKLNPDSLILVDKNQMIPTTYYYFKSDKEFSSVKEHENVEKRYSNGHLKIKGSYHNGFEDGLWEEWYENGQKKSEKRFKDGMPIGTWKEWNENGKLIYETKKVL